MRFSLLALASLGLVGALPESAGKQDSAAQQGDSPGQYGGGQYGGGQWGSGGAYPGRNGGYGLSLCPYVTST